MSSIEVLSEAFPPSSLLLDEPDVPFVDVPHEVQEDDMLEASYDIDLSVAEGPFEWVIVQNATQVNTLDVAYQFVTYSST